MNAGSTTADAASVTSTNGSWDVTADTFIATAATPFSGVAVGEWVSIYNDGVTTGAVYVAQVTALYLSGLGVVLSTTAKYGTKPAAGATGKSAKVGGAWASMAVVTSLGAVTVPAATRLNIKLGTYANTTVSRSLNFTGTTLLTVCWRGYNATPGDRDTDPTLTPPAITFTTGLCTFAGAHAHFTHLDISGANTGRQLSMAGANNTMDRCRVENTNAAAASSACTNVTSATQTFLRSLFKATSSATRVFQNSVAADFLGCAFVGGGVGLDSTVAVRLIGCILRANGSHGLHFITTASAPQILSNTFRGCGGDGIRFDVLPTSFVVVANNLFAGCGGYGINNNTGANSNVVRRIGNDYWNNTSGTENGFGDSPAYSELTESADPHTSATVLSLVAGALAKAGGQPGLFEGEPYTSFLDVGAIQAAAGGGGVIAKSLIAGGH